VRTILRPSSEELLALIRASGNKSPITIPIIAGTRTRAMVFKILITTPKSMISIVIRVLHMGNNK